MNALAPLNILSRTGWHRCGTGAASLLSLVLAAVYARCVGASAVEPFCFVAGAVVLWAPVGVLLFGWVPLECGPRSTRITFALVGSYALTTLGYFGCAALGAPSLFWILQTAAAAVGVALLVRRKRGARASPNRLRIDWGLVLLILCSLLSTVRYKVPFEREPAVEGPPRLAYVLFPDHLYHVGMEYQLAQGSPPRQCSIRGGSPERAYHHFSHLTCVLLATYTGQSDLLRVHLAYHYTVMEVLFCLCLFSLTRLLTGHPAPGYAAIAFMYPLAVAGPELAPNSMHVFYFTFFPHASSGLMPVASASPQMYSGLLVLFGCLIGMLLAWRSPPGKSVVPMAITGLMAAATLRFRVHIFLVLCPAALLLMLYLGVRSRRLSFAAAGAAALLTFGLLFFEMRNPAYLPGTSAGGLGYNGTAKLALYGKSWPFASVVWDGVERFVPNDAVRDWAMEVISAGAFAAFNVIGLPLLAATGFCLGNRAARQRLGPLTVLSVLMAAGSVVLSVCIHPGYDDANMAAQCLLHTRWFLLPFGITAAWSAWAFARRRIAPTWLVGAGLSCCLALLVGRLSSPPEPFWRWIHSQRLVFEADEWLALDYLRRQTPVESVVLTDHYYRQYNFAISGLAGRAAYLEFAGNPVDAHSARGGEDRVETIRRLWAEADDRTFAQVLWGTPVDFVVEFATHPLHVHPADALRLAWKGPDQRVFVWSVVRPVSTTAACPNAQPIGGIPWSRNANAKSAR